MTSSIEPFFMRSLRREGGKEGGKEGRKEGGREGGRGRETKS